MIAVKLVLYFVVLIAILALAYYTTKFVGNGMRRKQDSGSIRILERIAVARDSFLLVVDIQGAVMVLGVSPAGIQKICDLESYERGRLSQKPDKQTDMTSFSSIFAGQLKSKNKDKERQETKDERESAGY